MKYEVDTDLDSIIEECSRRSRAADLGDAVPPQLSADLEVWLASQPSRPMPVRAVTLGVAAAVLLVAVFVVVRPFPQPVPQEYAGFYCNDATVPDELCSYALNLLNDLPL